MRNKLKVNQNFSMQNKCRAIRFQIKASSFYYFVILIFLIATYAANASQSGIYMDNGVDRTIMHRILNNEDKLSISYEILQFLGIPDRPSHINGHSLSMKKSAPKFLLDVYHRIAADEDFDDTKRWKRDLNFQNNLITDVDKRAIDESDIIMTFLNKHNHKIDDMRHEHGQRLWFDIPTSDTTKENNLIMAELRIYQNGREGKRLSSMNNLTISVFFIRKDKMGRNYLDILSSVNTTGDYTGWLELNLTESVSSWLNNPEDNLGLYITARAKNNPDREVKLDHIGILHRKTNDEYQPFLIAFFKSPPIISVKQTTRTKRSISRKKKKTDVTNPFLESSIENVRSCQMQTLYIDFKDLGWHDWIIAPDGYGAFYCSGECNFPLNAHMNATNHAIVQTLVHLLEPKKVPKPCCAPTRLGALPVLYHLNDENVNLKKYRNMIVKSCGCH